MWANWKISLHLIETLLTVFCTKKSISEILLKLYSFPDWFEGNQFKSVNEEKTQDNCCCFLVTKLCLTLCDLMDCSMAGFPVLHHLWVCSKSCPLSQWWHPTISSSAVPSCPAFSLSQHQGLFQWVSSSHQMAKVLELQLQHQPFPWIFKIYFLYHWLRWSSCCPRNTQESSLAPQFKSIRSSALSFLCNPTLTFIHNYWKNHSFDYTDIFQQSDVSAF